MKKLIYTVTAALIMLAFVSCEKKETVKEAQSSVEKADMVFTATSESGALKTTMHSNGTTVVWSEGDKIKVFTAEDQTGSECEMTDPKWAGTATAEFAGQCAKKGPWTAICPSSSAQSYVNGNITLTMPETQTYVANTFASGAMPCVAYSESTTFNFKHTFGVLKLKLQLKEGASGSVKSITVTTKGSEKLNGTFTVTPSSSAAATKSGSDGTSSLILDCGSGVALSESTATDFWIVVPEGAFASGFDVTVTPAETYLSSVTLSTTKANTITAGKIKEMPVQIIAFKKRPDCQKALDDDANWVTIGTQQWLKVNTKCIEYDTKSEAFEASWLTDNTIPTSSSGVYTPYYTASTTEGYGYYYSWAAAVGVEDGEDYGTEPFSGKRQGICPNGSHIPTPDEWNALKTFIETTDGKGSGTAGKHLKSNTADWNGTKEHLDTYGFAALPAGFAVGSKVITVGINAIYWSSDAYNSSEAYSRTLNSNNDGLNESHNNKFNAHSVRCLRD